MPPGESRSTAAKSSSVAPTRITSPPEAGRGEGLGNQDGMIWPPALEAKTTAIASQTLIIGRVATATKAERFWSTAPLSTSSSTLRTEILHGQSLTSALHSGQASATAIQCLGCSHGSTGQHHRTYKLPVRLGHDRRNIGQFIRDCFATTRVTSQSSRGARAPSGGSIV